MKVSEPGRFEVWIGHAEREILTHREVLKVETGSKVMAAVQPVDAIRRRDGC